MDMIDHLVNLGPLPRWIKTPPHYAMLNIPQKKPGECSKNFILMEKIDHGVTVKDIIEPRSNHMKEAIIREF
jgi:hypothetical protein